MEYWQEELQDFYTTNSLVVHQVPVLLPAIHTVQLFLEGCQGTLLQVVPVPDSDKTVFPGNVKSHFLKLKMTYTEINKLYSELA